MANTENTNTKNNIDTTNSIEFISMYEDIMPDSCINPELLNDCIEHELEMHNVWGL